MENIQTNGVKVLLLVRQSDMSCMKSSLDWLSIAQVGWHKNNNLTQTLVFLAGVELKKINSLLRRLNLLIYFKRVESSLIKVLENRIMCSIFSWLNRFSRKNYSRYFEPISNYFQALTRHWMSYSFFTQCERFCQLSDVGYEKESREIASQLKFKL